MRERGGPTSPYKNLITVFWGQAILAWLVSAPLLAGVDGTDDLGILAFVGIAAWAVGLFFEAVGDWQLSIFKRDSSNHGKVLDSGLWGVTRHPNYFGDFMVWWGLFLVAADAGGWWSIYGPIVMSVLLLPRFRRDAAGTEAGEDPVRIRRVRPDDECFLPRSQEELTTTS